ncbi:MAG: YbfB/YjiJ family MFS transporter [Nevskia sp.]|nr:YbfB/YjiJ family MFS transporter [Nevskia sp.]
MGRVLIRSAVSPVADALAGALILAVGMGFGRFAFTGMYPLMVHEGQLTVAGGSLAASANYLGYLAGALMMSRVHHQHAARLCQAAMVGTVLSLAALSLDLGVPYILGVRLAAGIFSALAMVGASTWLFQVLGYHHGAPILFSGVGVGILLSAELIAGSGHAGLHSAATWSVLGAAAALLCALAWTRASRDPAAVVSDQASFVDPVRTNGRPLRPWPIIGVYGLAGFGYIVTATYLPLFVKTALGGADPIQVWAAFGLGAVPSCFLWHALHHRLGSRRALTLNLAVQAAGVVLPVLSPSPAAFMASAVLVGLTFVGTVTVAMPAAKRLAASVRYNMIAAMTASYGLGQVAGPLVANALLGQAHSFNPPLLVAGGALLLAAMGCLL